MSKCTKGAIRKTIHRTTSEVPLKDSESRIKVLRHSLPPGDKCIDSNTLNKNDAFKNKYHEPELNTIDLNSKFDKIQLMQSQLLKPKSVSELTPRTRAIVSLETTKKLNFPPDKSVYKNLIPINVNDSVLMIANDDDDDRGYLRKKYIRKTNKDPVPELSDFLEPIKPLKHKVPPYNKQDILRKPKNDLYPLIHKICTEFHPDYY